MTKDGKIKFIKTYGFLHILLNANVGLSDVSHLDEHHGGNLFRTESFGLVLVLDLDHRLVADTGHDGERPVRDIVLDGGVVEFTSNQSLGIENGVLGVHGGLIFGSIANETLGVGECDIRGGCAVTL